VYYDQEPLALEVLDYDVPEVQGYDVIVGRRLELRGPPPFQTKKRYPPTYQTRTE
jgi:hypothetical protein